MADSVSMSAATRLAQADHYVDPQNGAMVPPLLSATTYARDADYQLRIPGLSYSRDANPTGHTAEALLAGLEGGREALLFSSGMAAAVALFESLEHGDHVLAPTVMYHGLRDWLLEFSRRWGLRVEFVDTSDPAAVAAALRPGETRLLWVETPANPGLDITDISVVARLCGHAGAELAVDSTTATPVLSRPLALGANYVCHSATKSLNGHSDVVAGALVCGDQARLWDAVHFQRKHAGAVLGPFEAWLLLRGMRTLYLRVRESCRSAMTIAEHLHAHPGILRVLYPGLPDHPGHEVACRQMHGGFGSLLSVLVDGDAESARRFAASTRLFVPATSLGGVESLIEHRGTVEGPNSSVAPNLVRISVGIEDTQDLIEDLDQALATVASTA